MDHLALVRLHDAQDGLGQGGLSGAGLAHQTQDLPMAHVKCHVVEDLLIGPLSKHAAGAVAAGDMLDSQHQLLLAHGVSPFRCRVGMAAISRWV